MALRREWPRLLSPSNAMPPVIEPSPMTATTRRLGSSLERFERGGEAVGVAEDGRGVAVLDPVVLGLGSRLG